VRSLGGGGEVEVLLAGAVDGRVHCWQGAGGHGASWTKAGVLLGHQVREGGGGGKGGRGEGG
jgi:hypothetical protein